LVFLDLVVWVSCVHLGCRFGLSVPQPSDWLERLVSKRPIYYASSGTLNSNSVIILIRVLKFIPRDVDRKILKTSSNLLVGYFCENEKLRVQLVSI